MEGRGGSLYSGAGEWGAGNNGIEASLGRGQTQGCRQVRAGSQQTALVGQRIQTGHESEQRQGLSSPPTNKTWQFPFAGLSLTVAGRPVPSRSPTHSCAEPGPPAAGVGGSGPARAPVCSAPQSWVVFYPLSSVLPFLSPPYYKLLPRLPGPL